MDCFDKVEELLLAEGYTKEEIPAIMVSLVEQGFDPTGVVLGGIANMLDWFPKKKDTGTKPKMADIRGGNDKVDGSGKPKVNTTSQGTPRQGSLLTKKGTAQNFTRGRMPFTGTDPVPAASSKLPQPPKPPATSPGQMQIPGTSPGAQELRNITKNPNFGLPGNRSGFGIGDLDSERLARQLTGQQAPKPWWDGSSRPRVRGTRPSVRTSGSPAPVPAWNQTTRSTSGATTIPRTNANTRPVQPQAPVPAWTSQGKALNTPKNIPSASGVDAGAVARATLRGSKPTSLLSRIRGIRGSTPAQIGLNLAAGGVIDRATQQVAKVGGDALARGIFDVTGYGEKARQVNPELYGKSGPNLTPGIVKRIKGDQQRSKLAQQRAETQAASQPTPEPTGERSAAANVAKQELAKRQANIAPPAPVLPPPPKAQPKAQPKPEPVKQTGDRAQDEASWRKANRRLARIADMRKAGASREEINKVLYNRKIK